MTEIERLRERAEAAEVRLALIGPHLPAVLDALRSRIVDERWESQKTRFRDAKAALEALGGTGEAVLSAACTGPGCGEWQADPPLCPACQPGGSAP